MSVRSKSVLERVLSLYGKVVGLQQEQPRFTFEWHMTEKARKIIIDNNIYIS